MTGLRVETGWEWDFEGPSQPLTFVGAELCELFFEDSKQRRHAQTLRRLRGAVAKTRRIYAARSVPAVASVADVVSGSVAGAVGRALDGALSETLSPAVEVFLVTPASTTCRSADGAARAAFGPRNEQAWGSLRSAFDAPEIEADPSAIAVISVLPDRLIVGAAEAGAALPASTALRTALVEAGATLESLGRELAAAGARATPMLHFFDDEVHRALGLDGVTEVVIAALFVWKETGDA